MRIVELISLQASGMWDAKYQSLGQELPVFQAGCECVAKPGLSHPSLTTQVLEWHLCMRNVFLRRWSPGFGGTTSRHHHRVTSPCGAIVEHYCVAPPRGSTSWNHIDDSSGSATPAVFSRWGLERILRIGTISTTRSHRRPLFWFGFRGFLCCLMRFVRYERVFIVCGLGDGRVKCQLLVPSPTREMFRLKARH